MKGDMKLYELTINDDGIRLRHTNPNPMSAEQKHSIIMALIAVVLFALCIALVWVVTTLCDFLGLMLALVAMVIVVYLFIGGFDF